MNISNNHHSAHIGRRPRVRQSESTVNPNPDSVTLGSNNDESLFDGFAKRFALGGAVGALAGLTYGIIANDYPGLAAIAGLGIGGGVFLPTAVADLAAERSGCTTGQRVGVGLAAAGATVAGLAAAVAFG